MVHDGGHQIQSMTLACRSLISPSDLLIWTAPEVRSIRSGRVRNLNRIAPKVHTSYAVNPACSIGTTHWGSLLQFPANWKKPTLLSSVAFWYYHSAKKIYISMPVLTCELFTTAWSRASKHISQGRIFPSGTMIGRFFFAASSTNYSFGSFDKKPFQICLIGGFL